MTIHYENALHYEKFSIISPLHFVFINELCGVCVCHLNFAIIFVLIFLYFFFPDMLMIIYAYFNALW